MKELKLLHFTQDKLRISPRVNSVKNLEVKNPDPVRQQEAREYSKLSRRLLFLELGIGAILLLVLLFTGVSARLVGFLPFASLWSAALYLLILVSGYGIIVASLGYYQDFVLPHRYGLLSQNVTGWLSLASSGFSCVYVDIAATS